MRLRSVLAAVTAGAAIVGSASPGWAVPTVVNPVSDVHVTPGVATSGGVKVNITWQQDPGAAGVRVCERPGTTPDTDPTACSAHVDVPSGGAAPQLPPVHKNQPYVFTLFAYDSGQQHFSSGVSKDLDGTTLAMTGVGKIRYGAGLTLHTVLRNMSGPSALAGRTVALWAIGPQAGATWHQVASRTTDSTGAAKAHVTPKVNTTFQWRYHGRKDVLLATTSARKLVHVAYVVTATLTRSTVTKGAQFDLYGVVKPAESGAFVHLQRWINGTWTTLTTEVREKLQTLPNGRHVVGYLFTLKATTRGTFHLRVLRAGTAAHAAGRSPALTLVVS